MMEKDHVTPAMAGSEETEVESDSESVKLTDLGSITKGTKGSLFGDFYDGFGSGQYAERPHYIP